MENINIYVPGVTHESKATLDLLGGKAANLNALQHINGVEVPDGFYMTTEAYKETIGDNLDINNLLNELALLKVEDVLNINTISAKIRDTIEHLPISTAILKEIENCLLRIGDKTAYAVRSSATAEDLPAASFAGQHDTFLNIKGIEAIAKHINKCWASLFTDRAVIYRIKNEVDHRKVHLAVVIQKMVFPDVAGIMFTADPVSSNKKHLSIDASFGLGEALVAGLVNADNYRVCANQEIVKKISAKKLAILAVEAGGTIHQEIEPEQQYMQALTDEQILQLAGIGRKIEAYFGRPQDIEWCLVNDIFYIVQSRPITTLYPVPDANDQENHVYISVGHQQMMTDPMKPLGLSLWQLRAARPMFEAGGRLFVDVKNELATPAGRDNLLAAMEQHDPLIKDALQTIVERGDFIKPRPNDETGRIPVKSNKGMTVADILGQVGNDPAIVADLIKHNEASVEVLKQNIRTKSRDDLFEFILDDIRQSKQMIFDGKHLGVIIATMNASAWINEKMNDWFGEKNVADILSQSVSNNITSEMGLELLDIADAIRPHAAIIEYLQQVKTSYFLNDIVKFDGGQEVKDIIDAYLGKYGMRCAGEIDMTKTRWCENPAILIPIILTNIKNFEPGASKRKFEQGLQEALKKEQSLLDRLAALPDGEQKAQETKAMIDLIRNFAGYREYPKYGIVSRFFVYKQALLKEVEQLQQANVISDQEDSYYLTFNELREMVRTQEPNNQLISKRKEEFKSYGKLTPPRVMTSDGEIISGKYNHENLPPKAIAGLAVSSGVIEGRARVILNMEDADLENGDILVTSFTDPSWTPLFVSINGLVTEVGGLMTHGAVIAREYGLPAVVGVENATRLIQDGQRIRVNGTDGYVEIV
ncbi:phosphoenolpyruvate synthase [Pedobacter nutrimenti]|uniref:phosphoenolpyruvate synthase n=1 Tax=Pedobacter nutrimenti TaxID=1241337 RepID=UPI00292E4524|nr:phosphoenolpyruvate synthase [Pedobacter nutrimenti]